MIRFPFNRFGFLIITVASLALSGCASTSVAPLSVTTQRRSAAGVHVQSIHLRTTEKGLVVSGVVRRQFGFGGSLQSHLDVDVIKPDGQTGQQIAIDYIPRPIPRSIRTRKHSQYAVTLSDLPPPGSVIRVTHHPVSRSKCTNPPQ
jgi:hypothetical protein